MQSSLLSPGEKLKKLRKKYGFKQYELTGGEVSRNFISMVENGKANLTMRTAEVIARKANLILQDRNVDEVITAYELLESLEEQVEKIADDYFEMFDQNNINYKDIEKAMKFVFTQELTDNVFLLNVKIGDYYYEKKEFSTAILFYMSFFYYIPKSKLGKQALEATIIKTLKLLYLLGEFSKIIAVYNALIKNHNILSPKSKRFMSGLLIKTFIIIGEYQAAINYIEKKLANRILIQDASFKINLVIKKAFCEYKLKNYNNALEIFKSVDEIKSFRQENRQYKTIADIGLVLVNLQLKNIDEAKELIRHIEIDMEKIDLAQKNYYYVYMNLAHIYTKLDMLSKAEENLKLYFNSINFDDFDEQLFSFYEIIEDLMKYYEANKDSTVLIYMKDLLLKNSNKISQVQNNDMILEVIKFCLNNGYIDDAKEILKYRK